MINVNKKNMINVFIYLKTIFNFSTYIFDLLSIHNYLFYKLIT